MMPRTDCTRRPTLPIPTAYSELAMYIQDYQRPAAGETDPVAPVDTPPDEGTGGRVILWVAMAICLALLLNATGIRFPISAETPIVTPSD